MSAPRTERCQRAGESITLDGTMAICGHFIAAHRPHCDSCDCYGFVAAPEPQTVQGAASEAMTKKCVTCDDWTAIGQCGPCFSADKTLPTETVEQELLAALKRLRRTADPVLKEYAEALVQADAAIARAESISAPLPPPQPEGATVEPPEYQAICECGDVCGNGPGMKEFRCIDCAMFKGERPRAFLASHEAQIQAEAYEAAAKLVCSACRVEGMPDERGKHKIPCCIAWPIPAVAAALRGK